MARKGKNKNKQKKYNKKQFIDIVCANGCQICKNIGNPFFCYNSIYKSNPKRFAQVLKNLIHMRRQLDSPDVGDLNIEQFSEAFCNTGICNNIFSAFCPTLPECHTMFKAQVNNEIKSASIKHRIIKLKQKKKWKRKARYICQAYPTSFSSKNEKFKADIERILHGDNVIKQDSNKESDEKAQELPHRTTEGEEP